MQKSKYCTKCGTELEVEDKYCEKCGAPVKNSAKKQKNDKYDIYLTLENVDIYGKENDFTKTKLEIPSRKKSIVVSIPNSINIKEKLRLKGLGYEKIDGSYGDAYLTFNKINYHYDKEDYKKSELKTLRCPGCGALLKNDTNDIDIYKCEYCKSSIYFEGLSDEAYRAKTKIRRMKHDEIMADKNHQHKKDIIDKKYQYKKDEDMRRLKFKIIKGLLIFLAIFLSYYFVFVYPFNKMEKESIKQEKELQAIVDEVKILVGEEKFEEAYLKAKTIIYTKNWSSEIEEKWDEIRRETINYVIEEEKKVTGKSNHKPEKKGFFESIFG